MPHHSGLIQNMFEVNCVGMNEVHPCQNLSIRHKLVPLTTPEMSG